MPKTKLGISVGMLGAAIYFTSLFSGYLVPVVLAGYVLLFEENEWLKKNAVKAVAVLIFFSFLTTVINLIPNTTSLIDNIFAVFHENFNASFLKIVVNAIQSAVDIVKKVLFIGLGLKALNQGSISVPVVDKLIDKYM